MLLTAIIVALYRQLPPCPDHEVYDYIGWVVSQGGTLYVDAADQNWPGQMFIHTLSVAWFGTDLNSYRTFELVAIIPISCLILSMFLLYAGEKTAALLVIPIYQIMYVASGFWMSGQREVVAGPLLIAAAGCLLSRVGGGRAWVLVAQGVLLAAATLIRPTLLIMAPLLTLIDLLQMRRSGRSWKTIITDHALVALSILVPMGLLALAAIPSGALKAWYESSILFNVEVYGGGQGSAYILRRILTYVLASWHWYMLWSCVGAVILWRRNPLALAFVGMVLPSAVISLFVQGKGFGYHLGSLLPLMALLIACTMAAAWRVIRRSPRQPVPVLIAALALAVPVAGLASKLKGGLEPQRLYLLGEITEAEMQDQYEAGGQATVRNMVEVAKYIDETTPPEATVLFWERPCHVYTLAHRRSPLPAAAFAFLDEAGPEFSLFERWQADFERVMTERPPNAILFIRDPEAGGYLGISDPVAGDPKLADVLSEHLSEYRLEKTIGVVDVYRRIDG